MNSRTASRSSVVSDPTISTRFSVVNCMPPTDATNLTLTAGVRRGDGSDVRMTIGRIGRTIDGADGSSMPPPAIRQWRILKMSCC